MKKLKFEIASALAVFAMLMVGCKNNLVETSAGPENVSSSTTPYASESELTELSENGFVNYKIARYYANIAMQQFSETNEWENAKVSDYPLVIYDSNAENPKFYEFRIIKDNEEVGAISCVANSSDGEAVQYVMPFATEISQDNARSVASSEGKLVAINYPSNIGVKTKNSARVINSTSDDLLSTENGEEVSVLDFIENADAETLEALEITDEAKVTLIKEIEEEQENLKEYWDFIAENESIILATTDEEIQVAYEELYGENNRAVIHSQSTDYYSLSEYVEKSTWTNPGGWCGPYAMGFVTLGLGKKSGYTNIPTTNDTMAIYSMYQKFEDTIGTGPKTFSQLSKGLQSLTNYKLCTYPLGDDYTVKKNYIKNKGLPCISLRTSAIGKSWAWHYRVIIGTKTVTNNTKVTAFGKTLLNFNTYDNYYRMHDNSADGPCYGAFYEKANRIYQIRSAYVTEK